MRAPAVILAAVLVAGAVLSCGGSSKRAMTTKAQTPHDEIKRLVAQNTSMSRQLGMVGNVTEGPTVDAGKTTAADPPTRQPTRTTPPPPVASTCSDVCRITTSICSNADRICRIAREKLPNDDWARNKCDEANKSCTAARARCDKCQAGE